ncbi:BREX-2 system adenine-specific DNA-methyltransferase PglX [Nocardioides sp. Leaf285]|uniref:BREX-2 system adenine-specific DNA-methyltransferase PglX n=1 Tax=Nocardioides sp. Leaf285 TaxID=1736322 RepID=UPI00070394FC|nr:BREX-2 system adenine-specific DNA-methyltransferase PglX [Nocardioides sp. Leaf285]KQP66911.1 hypothetical protein ASF47_04180 [Nocardioides sp. Leaf285]
MIQSAALLKDLKAQLKLVQADLRARADDKADRWGARLQEEYAEARRRERTGHSWVVWRDNEVDQAAVAWLIAMTFVRFCEDNDLLTGARINGTTVPVGWIAGPGDRTARAEENLTAYFRENPTHNRRDWLRQAFTVLAGQPAGKALVDEAHNPVWTADISAERATALIDFWRATDSSGKLVHDFTDQELDTRFLGDLYQDLSDHARKTYALLQTPVFVEEFILDQTLTPALAEFGLDGIKLIDPTCGSGHFLLGAFQRLVDQWQAEAPALDAKERVRRAMDSIHGVDLNPFAVAIARFRLTVAGLLAMGERSLVGVPNLGFHLAIGDSLLGEFGGAPEALQFEGEESETYFYDGEDLKEYTGILKPGQYHVVVGNPPYIAPPDRGLKTLYRKSYSTASGQYALSAPFMELFFRLAIRGEQGQGAGFTGQITANSFMKREFGKKLIEEFFAGHHLSNPVDLTGVVDTSGAYIPGHGTPTVIIVGRRRRPVGDQVRAVLGVRGEPGQPADPSKGLVWTEIVTHLDEPGFDGKFVCVSDVERSVFGRHPWSLGGGGAAELKAAVETVQGRLGSKVDRMGMFGDSHAEEYFAAPLGTFMRLGVSPTDVVGAIDGNATRDWRADTIGELFFAGGPARISTSSQQSRVALWPWRTSLWARATFSGASYKSADIDWLSWHQVSAERSSAVRIAFAKIATHFSGALVRRDAVEKPGALRIELPEAATEDDHLALLGVLNSSTACFWMKQVSHNKGNGGIGGGIGDEDWEPRYEFTGTKLAQFPLPSALPLNAARHLDSLAHELAVVAPSAVIAHAGRLSEPLDARLRAASAEWARIRARMIFAQEELDWETYRLYGLIDDDFTYKGSDIDAIALGERTFEISLARRVADGEEETAWFSRHGSTPVVAVPEVWPTSYRDLVKRRLEFTQSDPTIRLLEKPEFKRRWLVTPWETQLVAALQEAILVRLEQPALWRDEQGPAVRSISELADDVRRDDFLLQLVEVLAGDKEADLTKVLSSVVGGQAVPYLAAHRYKPSGIEKFNAWQHVWELQRREDAGDKVDIPVPPKYGDKDFTSKDFWQARGKFDVPKERFILYPNLGREGDNTVVLGWAGWDHKDKALALAREFPTQDALGAGNDLLIQMVAGLVELEPWVHQWHSEMDASFGVSPAQAITGVIDQQLGRLEATRDEVTAWTPPAATRGRRPKNS